MSQQFENKAPQNTEKFSQYVDTQNPEALITSEANVEQKSAQYAELQDELASIGVDKNAVFCAMKELKGTGSASDKAKSMMEQLVMGLGEKMFEPGFDITKAMYKIGKIVAGSELVGQDVKDEFVNEIKTELNKQFKSEDTLERIQNLANYDELDFNDMFKVNAAFREGYSNLVKTLSQKYSGAEITKGIEELGAILNNSANGKEFLKTILKSEPTDQSAVQELINGFAALEDAELFFSNVKDKEELENFLNSEKTVSSSADTESAANGEKPSWMLG